VRFTELLGAGTYPKATMYRFLQTLTNQGMLAYDPERQSYSLGVRLVRLAHAAWSQSSLAPVARPWIDTLSADVGETIHLAQMDQAQVLYVDKRNATRAVEMFSQAGKVGPAYCTGVGKAMLAFLPPDMQDRAIERQSFHRFTPNTLCTPIALLAELQVIRKRGYAFDNEEHEPGIICIALPILTQSGRVMGALSVTSTTSRSSLDALAQLAPRIQETANAIAGEAESWRFPEDH
ncbi:MAG: IclR family transcriptional regulator, partial [Rhodoferax sp.]|nr:IclR family transcriptional regulator [Pseudorhodobacter sp.]